MRTTRGLLAALACLTLGLTGCAADAGDPGAQRTGAAAESDAPADARQALAGSTAGIAAGNYRFVMTGHEQRVEGVVHRPTDSARVSMTFGAADFSMAMQMLYIAPDAWTKVKITAPELPGAQQPKNNKWQHIDSSRLPADERQFDWEETDIAHSAELVEAIVAAERGADGEYTGTIDLTRVSTEGMVDEETVTALGGAAKAVPFRATLDDRGWLSALTLQVPAAGDLPAHEIAIRYADYGAATPPKRPAAAQTEEASEETYDILG